jgi:stage II sporulation protein D
MARRDPRINRSHDLAGFSRRGFLCLLAGGTVALGGLWWWRPWATRPSPAPPKETTPPKPTVEAPAFVHPPVPDTEPIVRVRVHMVRDADGSIAVGHPGQWLRVMQDVENDSAGPMYSYAPTLRGPLRVRIGPGSWSVTDASGFRAQVDGLAPFTIMPRFEDELPTNAQHHPGTLRLGERTYPGVLRFVALTQQDPSAFDVVNHVNLESYLPGVVTKELYNHWLYDTHAAQAIAARSFACSEHAHFRQRRHFDMTDTQASQVYAGATTHQTSIDAVANTHGMMLSYEGLLVPGYYSSCCGGSAATGPDAIGPNPINAIPPLLGRNEPDICQDTGPCTWQTQRPIELLSQRLVAYGKAHGHDELASLATVAAIEVAETNPHRRPTLFDLTDHTGRTIQIRPGVLRRAANFTPTGMARPSGILRSTHFSATIADGHITFEGLGHGHGVGMCQHGAQLLAREGADFIDILSWYYPGVQIIKAYE